MAHWQSAATRPPEALNGRFGRVVQLLCFVFAVLVLAADLGYTLWDAGLEPQAGTLDARFDPVPIGGGFVRVAGVEPGGIMARHGVSGGDRVAFDRPYDHFRFLAAGEDVAFTLDHEGRTSRNRVSAPPRTTNPQLAALQVIFDLATGVSTLFGAFVIWRGRGQPTSLLLGMALATYGLDWSVPPFWLSAPAAYPLFLALAKLVILWAIPVFFYAFALRFRVEWVGRAQSWEKAAFWAYASAQLTIGGVHVVSCAEALQFPIVGDGRTAASIGSDVGLALSLAYLLLGWWRSASSVRHRYKLMLVAIGAISLAQVGANSLPPGAIQPSDIPALLVTSILGGVIGPALLAYAIQRHRVFDLGFAVNRTLVYGGVSATLLTAFGLIEWAFDHFLPVRGREQNALVDATIAVAVFLTFHRVRDAVEHVIERLFFRDWQKAETTLRRFVREAAFATRSPTLTGGLAAALTSFANGAQVAIYLFDDAGRYRVAAGVVDGVGDSLDPDEPALMAMRAEPAVLLPEPGGSLPGAELIAPMINRNEMIGFAVLGPKPSGPDYRPDEIELVGWATRQVGLDLHALKMEQLEADKVELRQEVSVLRAKVEVLMARG